VVIESYSPDDIARAIGPNTKLVIVNHGSNVIGTVQPVAEVGRIFAIDNAQTAGVIPINMKEISIDVLAFTGHKTLMGSTGIGGLCVRKHVHLRQTARCREIFYALQIHSILYFGALIGPDHF
jgi:cysteine desulfurase/selenocysteine lyase